MPVFASAFANSSEFSDFTLVCDGASLPCHRVIVLNRCPAMRDAVDGKQVCLDGIAEPIARAFLQYLYTDTVDIRDDDVYELMGLSGMYGVERLSALCEARLGEAPYIPSSMAPELRCAHNNAEFTDLAITTADGDLIPAHKVILAARCPKLQLPASNELKLPFSTETVLELLRFVYSGASALLDEQSAEVNGVAEMYELPELAARALAKMEKLKTQEELRKLTRNIE